MTEDDARDWIASRFGAAGAARMALLADIVRAEAVRQNLVAPSTLATLWSRHIVDSAQLITLAATHPGRWLDIGSGAGFPGMVVAALTDRRVVLAEPRGRRAAFLNRLAELLGLRSQVTIAATRVQLVDATFDVISARAVASLTDLLAASEHCSAVRTLWLLPKGRTAREEVAYAARSWHGMFHVEHSVTDPESMIVRATGVARR